MVLRAETSASPRLAYQADVRERPAAQAGRMADAIRALALDAAAQAGADEPALTLAMAEVATALWARYHKFDAADPRWPDRDRFVLSAGPEAMLLYALIHLTGHQGMPIEALQSFCQLHSPACGCPEYGAHPAIEATTGPPGQGLAVAVGMALAERNMAARFGKSLVDHRTWVIASDADMAAGIGHEAAVLAGQLGLSKLTVLYGEAGLNGADDVLKRFSACGWAVKGVDGQDAAEINAALSSAMRSKKPTLLTCRATRGVGNGVHGTAAFMVPDDTQARWETAGSRGAAARRSWLKRLARHNQRGEFERVMTGRLPDTWHEAVADLKQDIAIGRPRLASRVVSQKCLDALLPAIPELIGGSADATGSDAGAGLISAGNYGGRQVDYGTRAHGMAAAATGMALHGGIIPVIGTGFALSDSLRPALRLCAMMRQRVVYVLGDDSIGLGEAGPTRQPVEHLASLRAMPDLYVFRPADPMETAECWELALRRADGPSLLVLSRQALPAGRVDTAENRSARGGYVLAEAEGPRRATILATGSEVAIAMVAREKLAAENVAVAVVSMPCWELFAGQEDGYRAQVLGGAPRVGIEAASGFGWDRWLGPEGCFIGMNGFGASGSRAALYAHFGITAEAVVAAVIRLLG